jgi:hypothetical protein
MVSSGEGFLISDLTGAEEGFASFVPVLASALSDTSVPVMNNGLQKMNAKASSLDRIVFRVPFWGVCIFSTGFIIRYCFDQL